MKGHAVTEQKEKMAVKSGSVQAPTSEENYTPLADIYETPDGTTIVEAELPGVSSDRLEIKVDKGVLTIQAQAKLPETPTDYANTYCGFTECMYFRAFAVSDEIDRDRIEADLANGLLTLRLPKAAAAKTRKIEVK